MGIVAGLNSVNGCCCGFVSVSGRHISVALWTGIAEVLRLLIMLQYLLLGIVGPIG